MMPDLFCIDGIIVFSFLCCNRLANSLLDLLLYWNCSYLNCCKRKSFLLFRMFSILVLANFSSYCISSLGFLLYWFVNCLILRSSAFSSSCCFIFLYDEYDMIVPWMTVFPVSHSNDGEISGESFISRKEAYSSRISVVNSVSSSSYVAILNVFFNFRVCRYC